MALVLRSPAFRAGEPVPAECTCEGVDVSPPLEWSGEPEGTRSFALIVDDPDAPDPAAPRRTFVHWVLYNLPAGCHALAAGAAADLPAGASVGLNDQGRAGYTGPCPPIGRHRYVHKLYALDVRLPVLSGADKAHLEEHMRGHVIGTAELIGTYQKRA